MKKRAVRLFAAMAAAVLAAGMYGSPHQAKQAVLQKIIVESVPGIKSDFIMGFDASQVLDIEKAGGKYYGTDAKEKDIFEILKAHGINYVRFRVWNNPTFNKEGKSPDGRLTGLAGTPLGGGNNSVANDILLAKRAKKAGMKILLDFHYSDFWADPAKQAMPQDWKGQKGEELCRTVQKFTADAIRQFSKAGAKPDMVQIGNELNNGFLWPEGKIWANKGESAGGMDGFINILKAASKGVRNAQGFFGKIKVVIHLANGGDNALYRAVFDSITKAKVDFDVIGLSFYTYWHGGVEDLKRNMEDLAKRYGKEMIVAETAYAFTSEDGDEQGNVFQVFSNDNDGYAPTVQGQATAVRDVIAAVSSVKGGAGVFYWGGEAIPVKGAGLSVNEGDTWENQAMFDFNGRALPSLAVWRLVRGGEAVTNKWKGAASNGGGFKPYSMADDSKSVYIEPGKTPALPKKIKVLLTNDRESLVDVEWDSHDWKNEKDGAQVKLRGTIEGTAFKPSILVIASSKVNIISDPSFESGKLGEWKLDGPSAACFVENNKGNAHTGKWTYKYWLDKAFKSTLTRKLENLSNGKYTISIWAMGGGGENEITLFAQGFDSTNLKKKAACNITNTGWKNWKKYTLTADVTSGEIVIGIYLDSNAGCWGNFDDVEVVKEDL